MGIQRRFKTNMLLKLARTEAMSTHRNGILAGVMRRNRNHLWYLSDYDERRQSILILGDTLHKSSILFCRSFGNRAVAHFDYGHQG